MVPIPVDLYIPTNYASLMLGEFSIIGPAVEEALEELGGFLWDEEWGGEADILKRRLVEVCRQWDDFLGAGGTLSEPVETAVESLDRGPRGREIYSFLAQIHGLSAALEALRAGDAAGAAMHSAKVAEAVGFSMSLHLGLEEAFVRYRGGEETRARWLDGLMKAMKEVGTAYGKRWRRLLEEALGVRESLDEVEATEMQMAYAKHAVCTAGILLHTHLRVLRDLGHYMEVPHNACEKLVPLLCARC
jgi:nucleotidyltransferase/DNA polymerase involved in DNA repair